jgi:surface antigen
MPREGVTTPETREAMKPGKKVHMRDSRAQMVATPVVLSRRAGLALAALLACAAPAQAQLGNPFGGLRGNTNTLTRSDYAVAGQTVRKLLNDTPVEIGRSEAWRNQATGNSGKFTILSMFTRNNMPCRRVTADIAFARTPSQPRSWTLDACQIPSGQWKVAS